MRIELIDQFGQNDTARFWLVERCYNNFRNKSINLVHWFVLVFLKLCGTPENWACRRHRKWSLNRQFQYKSKKNYRLQTPQNLALYKILQNNSKTSTPQGQGWECWEDMCFCICYTSILLKKYRYTPAPSQHLIWNFPQFSVLNLWNRSSQNYQSLTKQECIPVWCVTPACCPYLPACTAQGGCTWSRRSVPGPGGGGVPGPGGVYLVQGGGVPGPRGCTWSWGCVPGPGVYLVPGGVPCPGVCVPRPRVCVYLVLGRCNWSGGVPGAGGCAWSQGSICPGTPPCEQKDWQTGVKILPCPKLCLQAVIKHWPWTQDLSF